MKVIVCGDFTTCGKGLYSVKRGTAIDENIVALIKDADVSIVNLECPVADENDIKILKSGPHLRTEADTISYLKKCGFTHVTLANNHFCDYAENGVKQTIEALEKNEIGFVGGGRCLEEIHKPLYIENNGIKIAILNYCENEFSTDKTTGSNSISPISAYYDIINAKKLCNHVIVICHGGHEGYNLPSPRMKRLYRFFIEVGTDVVINHHQHCYTGWENYKSGKIFYGIGNFFFDDHRPTRRRNHIWNYGYIVSLNIDSIGIKSGIIPYSQCLKQKTTILIEDEKGIAEFERNISRLNNIIKDDDELNKYFNSFCKNQYKNIITSFAPYNCRILQALCRRGLLPTFLGKQRKIDILNKIRCESHRDVVITILKDFR